jgi:gluconokinase
VEQPLILALDIGTSSVRAAVYDAEANPIPRASVKIDRTLAATADGGSEIDADEALYQVIVAIDAVLEKTAKIKGEIEYVASCSFWHSLVGVDANGRPTTKVFGWADTRSGKYTAVFKKRFDETATHNRTGAHFHSSFWPAKLLWLRKDFTDIFAKTERWLSFSDYVALKLFGLSTTSVSMASGTGIFDIRKCDWDAELLRFLKVKPANLPAIVAKDSDTFTLIKKYTKRWPRLANAGWFLPVADGATDNIGAGCVTRSQAALMVGTSGAMRVAYAGDPPAQIPDGLWCYRIDRQRVILGGALSDGGGLYHWLKQNLKLPIDADERIAKREPGSHGLTFLPFLAGERSTGYHETASGSIHGLTSATDPVDILQAALESVAFRFAEIFDRLNSVGQINEVFASGGALRESTVWTKMIADVLSRDLVINNVSESSSRGACLLALESIGKIESIKQARTHDTVLVKSDQNRTELYRREQKRHAETYKSLIK